MGFFRKQLINVIDWNEVDSQEMVYRFPCEGSEIKNGAQLTVRPSQVAIFVNEGIITDVFSEGRYQLTTANLPVMTKLLSWKYDFKSPFKADVYFVNTRQFPNLKWGTANPIMTRDSEFGMVRIRAYGNYSIRVVDAAKFLKEIFGTLPSYSTKNIQDHIKTIVVSSFSDYIAETKMPILDIARMYDEIGKGTAEKVREHLNEIGLTTTSVIVENISLPEEVEKAIDKRSSMAAIGDLNAYAKYQTADSIKDAANNPGGSAGLGVGIGAGVGMGRMMSEAMNTANSAEPKILCPKCGKENPAKAKFCSECGQLLHPIMVKCVKCGKDIPQGTKFCPECGAAQVVSMVECPNCHAKVPDSAKFCPECGKTLK